MSKYTKDDADVQYLEQTDRIDYEFNMLNHDVDTNVEASVAFTGLRNIKDIKNQFKDPKKLPLAIITVLSIIIIAVLIILAIIYTILKIKGVEWKTVLLRKVILSLALIFVILIVFYFLFNLIYGEMKMLVKLSKQKENKS